MFYVLRLGHKSFECHNHNRNRQWITIVETISKEKRDIIENEVESEYDLKDKEADAPRENR